MRREKSTPTLKYTKKIVKAAKTWTLHSNVSVAQSG